MSTRGEQIARKHDAAAMWLREQRLAAKAAEAGQRSDDNAVVTLKPSHEAERGAPVTRHAGAANG